MASVVRLPNGKYGIAQSNTKRIIPTRRNLTRKEAFDQARDLHRQFGIRSGVKTIKYSETSQGKKRGGRNRR